MTWQYWAFLFGIAMIGFALARVLALYLPRRRLVRFAVLVLIPTLGFAAAPIVYFGWPVGQDWVWLTLIYGLIYPYLLAWLVGVVAEVALRRLGGRGGAKAD